MRVYRTIVNKGDVIHYIIKDGEFFFSEADLAAKHRIYGRSITDNVEILFHWKELKKSIQMCLV